MYNICFMYYTIYVFIYLSKKFRTTFEPVKKKTIDFQISYNIHIPKKKNSLSFNFKLTRLHGIPSKHITLL